MNKGMKNNDFGVTFTRFTTNNNNNNNNNNDNLNNISNNITFKRMTRAEININAIQHNMKLIMDSAKNKEVWAVVKANAYGHGAVLCARSAIEAGASGLCVALTQEGVELRNAGIRAPIIVLSEQSIDDIPLLVKNDLICVVYNAHYIKALAHESKLQRKNLPTKSIMRVHLKIDTGMHRAGVAPVDAVERAKLVMSYKSVLDLDGIMTHFATADDETKNVSTFRQIKIFRNVIQNIKKDVVPVIRHIHTENSAATLRELLPEATMVRVGIALYGLTDGNTFANVAQNLRPVMTLHTKVNHVQRLKMGEGISYGLRVILTKDATVATLPIGYADGIPRRAWNTSARILIGGKPRQILGVVTMDQLMVNCDDDDVNIGDEAIIFGKQGESSIRVEDWAEALETITYEIVCAISSRVPRDYIKI